MLIVLVDKDRQNDIPADVIVVVDKDRQSDIPPDVILALTNSGGVRFDSEVRTTGIYKAGDFTTTMPDEILPFGNTLAILELTGAELREVLEHGASALPEAVGFFCQVSSGVVVEIDTSKPSETLSADEENPPIETPGERIVTIRVNGVEICDTSIKGLEIVHCPVCTAVDPFSIGDCGYQCQACGTIFVVLRGPS